ncbi:aspartate aminotransferase family protein [Zavarzinia sp. CC-PAN008]|uniref:aspartate aminotransferase family protein n=1 Tax=Zavarzinia sp. CC-PAN008 TaxID=3243332 RepID=UPI003F7454FA
MSIQGNSMAARDIAHLIHPYTNLATHHEKGPLIITEGRGVRVFDDSGRDYIEGMSGLWCTSLGWNEEELIEAAVEQMRKLPTYHAFSAKSSEPSIILAEKLKEMVPFQASKVFFANSGSEANDSQIKLAWYCNNAVGRHSKKKIIGRIKGYHGITIASGSATGLPVNHRDFDLPIAGFVHTDTPHFYRGAEPGETEEQFAGRLAQNLEELILREGPETISSFIAEPVMGAGGVIVPPAGYFDAVQKVLAKYDIRFIADEVITGFGRTGNMFGCETYGIEPNSLSVAKQLSSAYLPISAVIIDEPMFQAMVEASKKIGTFGHGFTYSGHPAAAAVAVRTLEIYEKRRILDHVRSIVPHFQKRLRAFGEHPLVGEARGVGLVGALEMVADKRTKQSFQPTQGVGARIQAEAQEQGLIIRAMGDSIGFCPPLIITTDEIDEMFDKFGRALDKANDWVTKSQLRAA